MGFLSAFARTIDIRRFWKIVISKMFFHIFCSFLTRRGCHLCHQAREVVERVAPDHDVTLEIIDVDTSEDLARRFGEEVPVLLVDGAKAFKFRIDEGRLRRRLRRWQRSDSRPHRGARTTPLEPWRRDREEG